MTEEKLFGEYLMSAKEDFIKQLWNPGNWSFFDDITFEKYKKFRVTWSIRLDTFRDKYPYELGVYLLQFFQGKFPLKVSKDWEDIKEYKKNGWKSDRKVQFLINTYEFSYQYLGLLTFINNIDDFNAGEAYSKWYFIEKSIGARQSKNDCWRIHGEKVSGKNWVIEKSPLSDFYDIDFKLWKKLRNAASHNSIIIKKEKIFYISNKEIIDYTDQIELLVKYIYSFIELSIHFHFEQFIVRGYWIFPFTISNLPKSFDFKYSPVSAKVLDFDYEPLLPSKLALSNVFRAVGSTRDFLFRIFYKKRYGKEPNVNEDGDVEVEKLVLLCFIFFFIFISHNLWDDYRQNKCNIYALLNTANLRVNEVKLNEFQQDVMLESFNTAYKTMIIWGEKFIDGFNSKEEVSNLHLNSFDDLEQFRLMNNIVDNIREELIKNKVSLGVFLTYVDLFQRTGIPINRINGGLEKFIS